LRQREGEGENREREREIKRKRERERLNGFAKQKKVFSSFFHFFRLVFDDEAHRIEKTNPVFSPSPSLSFPLCGPSSDAREFLVALSEAAKTK
jgi:hypothetical protein